MLKWITRLIIIFKIAIFCKYQSEYCEKNYRPSDRTGFDGFECAIYLTKSLNITTRTAAVKHSERR